MPKRAPLRMEVSKAQAAARDRWDEEREYLEEWCAWVRGDPGLSAWEEDFATSMRRRIDGPPPAHFLSLKQYARMREIGAKTGFRGQPVPDAPEEADDVLTAGFDADDDVYAVEPVGEWWERAPRAAIVMEL